LAAGLFRKQVVLAGKGDRQVRLFEWLTI